jgi:hypothetical protein
VNDKVSTLLIAVLGGAVAVLGVGQLTGAGADSGATSQQPTVIRVEIPSGGDTTGLVKLSDVAGLCALGSAPHNEGSAPNVSARSVSRAGSNSAVNSSGNSANVNTNVLALSNQIALDQKTVVVQESANAAAAAQQQAQDPTTTTVDPNATATDQGATTTTAAPTTTTAAPTTTTAAPTTTVAPTIDTSVPPTS